MTFVDVLNPNWNIGNQAQKACVKPRFRDSSTIRRRGEGEREGKERKLRRKKTQTRTTLKNMLSQKVEISKSPNLRQRTIGN